MKPLMRCVSLLAALGLASCGGDVGVGIGVVWHTDDYPWPNHPDWPKWPDHPQGTTGLFPIAGDVCGVCSGSKDGTGPAARFFLPAITIVMGWLVVRAALLFLTSRLTGAGVRRWTLSAGATDLLLALVLLVGLQIAALVVALIGATAPLVASFSWILALSFVATGLMLLEVASCARASEDV